MEPFRGANCQVEDVDADSVRGQLDPLLRESPALPSTTIDVELLYRDHRQRLLGLAAAVTLDPVVAEEIVQDAFEGLQRNARRVENPVGYLQRSVINLGVNRLRRRRVAARHPITPPVSASTPEIDETWGAVLRLPAKQRAVVVLRFWQDMTIEAIADTLCRPVGSVKSTLHRALPRVDPRTDDSPPPGIVCLGGHDAIVLAPMHGPVRFGRVGEDLPPSYAGQRRYEESMILTGGVTTWAGCLGESRVRAEVLFCSRYEEGST